MLKLSSDVKDIGKFFLFCIVFCIVAGTALFGYIKFLDYGSSKYHSPAGSVRITESATLYRPDGIPIHVRFEYEPSDHHTTYRKQGRETYERTIAKLVADGAQKVERTADGRHPTPEGIRRRHDIAFSVEVRPLIADQIFLKAYTAHPADGFVLRNGASEVETLPEQIAKLLEISKQIAPIVGTCVDQPGCG